MGDVEVYLSSIVTIELNTESLEEVSVRKRLAHGIFNVLALKIKDHGIN